MGDPGLDINIVDNDLPSEKFEFGFNDHLEELIDEFVQDTRSTLDGLLHGIDPNEPTSKPAQSTHPPGSPEYNREKRYTPRSGLWCGHETVLRSWNHAASAKCQDCGLTARWLWSCTADTPDHSGFVPDPEPVRRDVSILAPWVQLAIANGEYTEAQVEKLLDQKVKVLELAASERRRVAQQHQKESVDVAQEMAAMLFRKFQRLANRDENTKDKPDMPSSPKKSKPAKTCRMLICANCKPRFFENGWGGIDAIAKEAYLAPPQIPEYLDRPISDASTLRAMREHCRGWDWSPLFTQWWETVRFARGYDLLPILLMAEMVGSDQTDFIELIGQVVLGHQMTYSQMCRSLYLINLEACIQLAPFFGVDASFMSMCNQPESIVVPGQESSVKEEESQS